jgi:hypothetical protein
MFAMRSGWAAPALVAFVLLAPGVSSACCTDHSCAFCVSSSTECTGRCGATNSCVVTWNPVCNMFGCNCNNTGPTCQCGLSGFGPCQPVDCCNGDSAGKARERFKLVDTDGNGKISMEEARKWLVKTFGEDWKGHVDKDDVAAGKVEAKILEIIFDRADKNHDKSISPDEFDNTLAGGGKK